MRSQNTCPVIPDQDPKYKIGEIVEVSQKFWKTDYPQYCLVLDNNHLNDGIYYNLVFLLSQQESEDFADHEIQKI